MCAKFENCSYTGVSGGKTATYSHFSSGKDDLGEKALYNTGTPLDFMVLSFYDFFDVFTVIRVLHKILNYGGVYKVN